MDTLLERLEQWSTKGFKVHFSEKGKPLEISEVGEVIDEVSVFDTDYKFFIQKIKDENDNIAFRFCYYTLDANRTRLVFGQYASQLSEGQFKELMTKAEVILQVALLITKENKILLLFFFTYCSSMYWLIGKS